MKGRHSRADRSRMLPSRAASAVSALAALVLLAAGFFTHRYAQTLLTAAAIVLVALGFFISHRSARKVRSSEQWLATTLASIGDGVIATDGNGCVRFTNA